MLIKFVWSSTVAMSWLWGLGFFFSIHFAQSYGWIGLLLFAVPNALGLQIFGMGLNRLRRHRDLRQWIEEKIAGNSVLFLAFQIAALSLSLFAVMKYLFAELDLNVPIAWGIALLCTAMLAAETLGLSGIARLHTIMLAGVAACLTAVLFAAPAPDALPIRAPYDGTFAGIVLPLICGLLLGPWLDLQQWQRSLAMLDDGVDMAEGYAFGAVLFFGLIVLVGGLSLALVPGSAVGTVSALDLRIHNQALLTAALQANTDLLPLILFAAAACLAMISTMDSAHLACRWVLSCLDRRSGHALYGLLPQSLRTSTIPGFALAFGLAWLALSAGADLEHFMLLFATLFPAFAVDLILDAFDASYTRKPRIIVFLVGLLSMAVMAIGYFELLPAFMALGGLLPFSIAAPHLIGKLSPPATGTLPTPETAKVLATRTVVAGPANAVPAIIDNRSGISSFSGPESRTCKGSAPHGQGRSNASCPPDAQAGCNEGWFDGNWFTLPIIPTYSDTNSVGNVYFASYVTWIGRTRELFFRKCMPDFDIDETEFFILTRSFTHKFVREIREFEPVNARLRIASWNRKFVTLEHEIRGADGKLIGSGEQTLMFVKSDTYALLDIPDPVASAFVMYT